MICKDCIHYEVCQDGVCDECFTEETPKTVREMYSPLGCETFKNKADFVEVVRCEKCKHLTVHNSSTLYAYCEKKHYEFKQFETDTRTHFCGYGERKYGKDTNVISK